MALAVGQQITTPQLAALTAGGDNYIRTKNKQVRGLAYKINENPYAPTAPGQPGIILFGTGRRRKTSAYLFRDSGAIVPAFIKRKTNRWEYIGDFRTTGIDEDTATIRTYCGRGNPNTKAGVLFVAPAVQLPQTPDVEVVGRAFGTPETRKAVERAAVDFVTGKLEQRGFTVKNLEKENLGYDLSAVRNRTTLLVEVKGTDSTQPHFFLTRNEDLAANQRPDWRLFIVCNARRNPSHHEYTADEMRRTFAFDPLAWECVQKTT